MRTKIVYVVTSDPKDYYLEQTFLSVYSVRKYNQNVTIELVVDAKTNETIIGKRAGILSYIDKKIVIDVPPKYNKVQTSRYMKTSLREIVNGDYLFVDSDTIITENLNSIDQYESDIMAVINEHVPISQYFDSYGNRVKKYAQQEGWKCSDDIPYYNSGVMYVRDTDIAHQFYADWHSTWEETIEKYGRHYDQPPLALINERYGYVIKELPAIWNCQILRYGLPYLSEAKIIHYFAAMFNNKDLVYAFRDNNILKSIRDSGMVSDEIAELVNKAKSAFVNPTRVCTGSELSLLSGDMALFCVHHPKITAMLNFLFRMVVNVINIIKKRI